MPKEERVRAEGDRELAGSAVVWFRSVLGISVSQARVTSGPFSAGTLCVSYTRSLSLEGEPSTRESLETCLFQSAFPGQSQSQGPRQVESSDLRCDGPGDGSCSVVSQAVRTPAALLSAEAEF